MTNKRNRVIAEVRRRILNKSSTYICLALDDIAEQDHRREIGRICAELKSEVRAFIAPYTTFGDMIVDRHTVISREDVLNARLAWLDRAVEPTASTSSTDQHQPDQPHQHQPINIINSINNINRS